MTRDFGGDETFSSAIQVTAWLFLFSGASLSLRSAKLCPSLYLLVTPCCVSKLHACAAGWGSGLSGVQLLHQVLGFGFCLASEKGEALAQIPLSPTANNSELSDYLTCPSLL